MSLLDALLLDPLRINVWIVDRGGDHGDYVPGAGTQNDPYNNFYSDGHGLVVGDVVWISKADFGIGSYSRYCPVTGVPATDTFQCTLPDNPNPPSSSGSSPSGYFGRLWTGGRAVLENNIIEIIPAQANFYSPGGIEMGFTGPDIPPVRFPQAVLRRNVIRHVDGASDLSLPFPSNPSLGISAEGCGALIVEENVVDVPSAHPIRHNLCGDVEFFANQSHAGALIQGFNQNNSTVTGELPITISDAEGLAC